MAKPEKAHGQFKSAAGTTLKLFLWILVVLFFIYLFTGIYSVANNEIAVHQRFGKIINPRVPPGMHYSLPWPIDKVSKVSMTKVLTQEIQDFSQNYYLDSNSKLTFSSLTGLGTYLITGDNNLVNLTLNIKYEIVNPEDYLFNLGEDIETAEQSVTRYLIEMACNSILHCFAKTAVDNALINWDPIINTVKRDLQKKLDQIESGLSITFVEIKALAPPSMVKRYFDDVSNAKIDKKKAISEAEAYENEEIPAAEGRAQRLRSEAESYYFDTVETARGEADHFNKILVEYRKDKKLTKYQLYMETVQEILGGVGKYYVVDSTDNKKAAKIKLFK